MEEEEESAFISMTDMTVSFLFIIMILLAFFATQMAPKGMVPEDLYERVRHDLEERDLQVQSLLRQIEVYRLKGDQAVPWLQAERERLLARVAELEVQAASVRSALRVSPEADVVREARLLRDENDRLHRLLTSHPANPIESYNSRIAEFRGRLLDHIQMRIKAADKTIDVAVSRNRDALEFKGDGLFGSGSDVPSPLGKKKMEVIAGILRDELRCVSLGDRSTLAATCNPATALVDALQVEGHTDNTGPDVLNMDLSSRRGAAIYTIMATSNPDLLGFRNLRSQPILSVAGYGKGRPIRSNDSDQARDANRRIDLRFIMFQPTEEQFVPQRIEDLPGLQERLNPGGRP
jgi:flagellar motor protein MotB